MRKALVLSVVVPLATAAVAVAAGVAIKVTVTPNTPSAQSALRVSATGPYSQSGLPKSLRLTLQKGFRASAKSVPVLCNSRSSKVVSNQPNPCPAKSKIGSGKVVANVSGFGQETAPFTLYLGRPRKTGDVASIVLSANVPIVGTQNVIGRLFKTTTGSMEILFKHLPSAPSGVTIKVKRLVIRRAYAVNGTHSLITNPRSCTTGHWTGTFTLTFASGTVSQPTQILCTK